MKWFIVLAACVGLFAFSLYAVSGSQYNPAYRYDRVSDEYVNVNDNSSSVFWDKTILVSRYLIELSEDSFNTLKTFKVQDNSLAARFFGNGFVNLLMFPVNFCVNIYRFIVKVFNLFLDIPIVDTSFGGGGGGFHSGR